MVHYGFIIFYSTDEDTDDVSACVSAHANTCSSQEKAVILDGLDQTLDGIIDQQASAVCDDGK